jgi:hypothetical protein
MIKEHRHFDDGELRFINREVERRLWEPKLPSGGAKERGIIERLNRVATDEDPDIQFYARHTIAKWAGVLPSDPRNVGPYYTRKPLTPRADKDLYDWSMALIASSRDSKQPQREWLGQMVLDGLPTPVSNFKMECVFMVRKSEGTVDRLVRLQNVLGQVSKGEHLKASVILDARSFASPARFRSWCLARGNVVWEGNATDLQNLREDFCHASSRRIITRVDSLGTLRVENHIMWFGKDRTYVAPFKVHGSDEPPTWKFPPARRLRADENGIYWFNDEGYYLSRKGPETAFGKASRITA